MLNIKKLENISKRNEDMTLSFFYHLSPFFTLPIAYYGFHFHDINLLNLFLYGSETNFDKFFNGLMLFVNSSLVLFSVYIMLNLIYAFFKLNVNLNEELKKEYLFKARTNKKVELIVCKMSVEEIKELKRMEKSDYFNGFYDDIIVPILVKQGHY